MSTGRGQAGRGIRPFGAAGIAQIGTPQEEGDQNPARGSAENAPDPPQRRPRHSVPTPSLFTRVNTRAGLVRSESAPLPTEPDVEQPQEMEWDSACPPQEWQANTSRAADQPQAGGSSNRDNSLLMIQNGTGLAIVTPVPDQNNDCPPRRTSQGDSDLRETWDIPTPQLPAGGTQRPPTAPKDTWVDEILTHITIPGTSGQVAVKQGPVPPKIQAAKLREALADAINTIQAEPIASGSGLQPAVRKRGRDHGERIRLGEDVVFIN